MDVSHLGILFLLPECASFVVARREASAGAWGRSCGHPLFPLLGYLRWTAKFFAEVSTSLDGGARRDWSHPPRDRDYDRGFVPVSGGERAAEALHRRARDP